MPHDQTNRPRSSQHNGLTMPYHAARPNQKPSVLACGIPYQTLPRSCARGANPFGVFGLVRGPLTRCYHVTDLAVCHSITLLPIITGRGVKYTHNDIQHLVLHTDSGPTRIRLVPEASDPKEVVMRDPYVISINRRPQHIDAVFKFTIRWLVIANIVLGVFTLVNLVIYPKYIYEAPVPILHSPHVTTLHPTPPRDIGSARSGGRRSSPHDHVNGGVRCDILHRSKQIC